MAKEHIVESILIGWSILMITNLNDTYLRINQTGLQKGCIVDFADWLQMRTGWDIRSRHWHCLETLIENQTRSVAQVYQVVDFKIKKLG